MGRKENLAYARTLARQFDLFPSFEALDALSDGELVRIRGMPFHGFSELIERLIEAEEDRQHQTPKSRASPHTKGIGEGTGRQGRWPKATRPLVRTLRRMGRALVLSGSRR
jgi:hypothetical protein